MGAPKKKKPGQAGAAKKIEPQIVPHRNLYVGNLAGMDMTQEKLSDLFKACGEVTKVQFVAVPLPPAKNPFGLVEFATVEDASSAIERLHGESGMLVKYHNTLSDGTNAPKELPREAVVEEQEEPKEGCTEEASGDEKPDVACAALVHPDPVGAARCNYPNPVENLQALVQKATREGSSIRDHLIYTVEEIEEDFGALVATVELRLPAGCQTSRGEPKDTKKEATKSAAQVALRNPEVHRLLPPLPPKVREVKASKAEDSGDEEEEEDLASTACTEKISVKKQRQLQKEEVRAKRQAKRNAAKAIQAALAAEESDDNDDAEEEESEDGEDSTRQESEDQEESEEEDGEDSSDEDEDDLVCVNASELAAKMKVIKERIGSQSRKREGKSAGSKKEKDKSGFAKAEKAAQKSQQQSDTKVIGIEVVFTSAWSQTGAKTNYVKP